MNRKLADAAVTVDLYNLVFALAFDFLHLVVMDVVSEMGRLFFLMSAICRCRSPGVLDWQDD
jgi:hypothetical protein